MLCLGHRCTARCLRRRFKEVQHSLAYWMLRFAGQIDPNGIYDQADKFLEFNTWFDSAKQGAQFNKQETAAFRAVRKHLRECVLRSADPPR